MPNKNGLNSANATSQAKALEEIIKKTLYGNSWELDIDSLYADEDYGKVISFNEADKIIEKILKEFASLRASLLTEGGE